MAITMAIASMESTMVMESVMVMDMDTENMPTKTISCSKSKIDRITPFVLYNCMDFVTFDGVLALSCSN